MKYLVKIYILKKWRLIIEMRREIIIINEIRGIQTNLNTVGAHISESGG